MKKSVTKKFVELIKAISHMFLTTTDNNHFHSYEPGDDKTSSANDHTHEVINGVVQEAHGHTHKILKER